MWKDHILSYSINTYSTKKCIATKEESAVYKDQQPHTPQPPAPTDKSWLRAQRRELPSRAHLAHDRPGGREGGVVGCHQQSRPPASSCDFRLAEAS